MPSRDPVAAAVALMAQERATFLHLICACWGPLRVGDYQRIVLFIFPFAVATSLLLLPLLLLMQLNPSGDICGKPVIGPLPHVADEIVEAVLVLRAERICRNEGSG